MWAAGQLFSFEAAFLLFLFAGAYKVDPRFAWFPGDVTLVFFALSVVAGLVPLLRGSLLYVPGIKAVCAGLIFVVWIAATKVWSPSEAYASEKLISVVGGNLWCLTATAMIISSSRARVWRFLVLLLFFGVALAADYSISSLAASDTLRVGYYLVIGRLCGLAALVAFVLWLQSPRRHARGPLLLAAFAVCGYVLLQAGGRNPTAAVAVGMLVPPLLGLRLSRAQLIVSRRILASVGLIAMLAVTTTFLVVSGSGGSSLRTLQRFDSMMGRVERGESVNPRVEYWEHAVAYWVERPVVGHGIGAWPILYNGADQRHYPHNLILELLVESGAIGLGLFVALTIVLTRRVTLQRLREDPVLMCAVMLSINAFVNAMTTGDLADNRNLFAMLGLLAMRSLPGSIAAGGERPPLLLGVRGATQGSRIQ